MNNKSRIVGVRRIVVDRVNLHMNDYASGLPSPLAFLGLAAAMAPELRAERWEIKVLPILHSVVPSEGRTKPEMEPKGSKFKSIETAEDMIGHVVVSLLLILPHHCSPDQVKATINKHRIAGGVPRPIAESQIDEIEPNGSGLCKMTRGYAVIPPDRAENLVISTGGTPSLSSVASRLYPDDLQAGSGWQVPVAVGHHLLEDPATAPHRTGTRSPTIPHVFSEPVVGIAELVSVRNARLTQLDRQRFEQLFWRWSASGTWILGHPAYDPNNPTPIETYKPIAQESVLL